MTYRRDALLLEKKRQELTILPLPRWNQQERGRDFSLEESFPFQEFSPHKVVLSWRSVRN